MWQVITTTAPDDLQIVQADSLNDLMVKYPEVLYAKRIG